MSITKRTMETSVADLIHAFVIDDEDLDVPTIQQLTQPSSTMATRDLKIFTIVNRELY